MTRRLLLAAAGLLLTAAPLLAQGENPRANQARILEYQKNLLIALVDSMPDRLLRDKATPAQRDFAQQIHHAASVAAYIASSALGGGRSSLPDTAAVFRSKAALRSYVAAAFDYSAGVLRNQTAASRAEEGDLFGQKMPKWQIWDEIYT